LDYWSIALVEYFEKLSFLIMLGDNVD